MIKNYSKFKNYYVGIDFVSLVIALFLGISFVFPDFWFFRNNSQNFYFHYFSLFMALICIYLLCLFTNSLYWRNIILSRRSQFILIFRSVLVGCIFGSLFMVCTDTVYFSAYGKKLLVYFTVHSFLVLIVFRVFIARWVFLYLIKRNIYKTRILIVGGDEAGKRAAKSLMVDRLSGFQVVGFLDDYKRVGEKINGKFHNLGKLEDIARICLENNVEEILIAIDDSPYGRIIHIVDHCLQTDKVVRIYSNLLEVITQKMKMELYSNIPVVSLAQYSLHKYFWTSKRMLDIIASFFLLIILAPLFLTIALIIKLSSKGPVIYKQTRIGKEGRPFTFYKFRSMHINNDDTEHREFIRNLIRNGNQNKNMKIFRITDDPRIFKFGKFIRKTSLDEFPQLINVLKGDMSLVGPRPCMPFEWDLYDDWHKKRLNIVPGCTGLWQVLGRATVDFEEMVILDLYYISNMRLWFDLKILIWTFPVLLLAKGGY